MNNAGQEMTLTEWVGRLPERHKAREELEQLRAQLTEKEIHSAFYHGFCGTEYDACCADTTDAVEEGKNVQVQIRAQDGAFEQLRAQLEETEKDRDLQFELQMKANRKVFQIEKQLQRMQPVVDAARVVKSDSSLKNRVALFKTIKEHDAQPADGEGE